MRLKWLVFKGSFLLNIIFVNEWKINIYFMVSIVGSKLKYIYYVYIWILDNI